MCRLCESNWSIGWHAICRIGAPRESLPPLAEASHSFGLARMHHERYDTASMEQIYCLHTTIPLLPLLTLRGGEPNDHRWPSWLPVDREHCALR